MLAGKRSTVLAKWMAQYLLLKPVRLVKTDRRSNARWAKEKVAYVHHGDAPLQGVVSVGAVRKDGRPLQKNE